MKSVAVAAKMLVEFRPGDRVHLKHRPDVKGTVTKLSSWHGYDDVVWELGKPVLLRIRDYHIQHDSGGSTITMHPADDYELDVE